MGRHADFEKPALRSQLRGVDQVPRAPEANCGSPSDTGGRASNLVALHFGNAADPRPGRYRLFSRREPAAETGSRQCARKAVPRALSPPLHRWCNLHLGRPDRRRDQPDLVCRSGDLGSRNHGACCGRNIERPDGWTRTARWLALCWHRPALGARVAQ